MSEKTPASSNETTASKRQRHLTIFDAVPILLALAIAVFFADYIGTRFGVIASIAAFVVGAVLAFLVVGYAFHIFYAFVSWICRVIK